MLNEEISKYRLESLKMAYEISFKIGNIKDSYDKDDMQIRDDLQDVFTLADMNYQYIINGIHPDMNLQNINVILPPDNPNVLFPKYGIDPNTINNYRKK